MNDGLAIATRPHAEAHGGIAAQATDRSAPAALRLERVSKSFDLRGGDRLEVLRSIDLTVPHGSIAALLGRSGCGKSTLLHIVAGLTEQDSGEVWIDGKPAATFHESGAVGYMFQDDRLLPWRTALNNVALSLEPGNTGRRERLDRAREMLEMVGLAGFENAYPNELSGGMRSRVALARSLAPRPGILLMDEPFSRLDAQTRSAMHAELVRLRDLLGMTVLFVTHDIEEAAVLAEQVTVLAPRPGRIVEQFDLDRSPPPRDGTGTEAVETARALKAALGEPSTGSDGASH